MPKSLEESPTQNLILPICLGASFVAAGLAVAPLLSFFVGAAALLASPLTLGVLGGFPVVIASASKPFTERPLWVFLACGPFLGFLDVCFDSKAFGALSKLTGLGPPDGNLAPPVLAGHAIKFIAIYVALLTAALRVRIRDAD
jgi:hypothetical protein